MDGWVWINGLRKLEEECLEEREVRLSGSIDACPSPVNTKYIVIRWRHCRLSNYFTRRYLFFEFFVSVYPFHFCLILKSDK